MTLLAERLTEARKKAGYRSARAAAAALGVKYPTYATHENGTRTPKAADIALYSKRFNVSQSYILEGKGSGLDNLSTEQSDAINSFSLYINPDIHYDVMLGIRQELVKQNKKKMTIAELSLAIALGYEEKHRKLNGLPPMRPDELATLIKRPENETSPLDSAELFE